MNQPGNLDNSVRLAVYRHFAEQGICPTPGQISDSLDIDLLQTEKALERLAQAHVLVLAPGSSLVLMAHPFSGLPTDYQTQIGGKKYWGN